MKLSSSMGTGCFNGVNGDGWTASFPPATQTLNLAVVGRFLSQLQHSCGRIGCSFLHPATCIDLGSLVGHVLYTLIVVIIIILDSTTRRMDHGLGTCSSFQHLSVVSNDDSKQQWGCDDDYIDHLCRIASRWVICLFSRVACRSNLMTGAHSAQCAHLKQSTEVDSIQKIFLSDIRVSFSQETVLFPTSPGSHNAVAIVCSIVSFLCVLVAFNDLTTPIMSRWHPNQTRVLSTPVCGSQL